MGVVELAAVAEGEGAGGMLAGLLGCVAGETGEFEGVLVAGEGVVVVAAHHLGAADRFPGEAGGDGFAGGCGDASFRDRSCRGDVPAPARAQRRGGAGGGQRWGGVIAGACEDGGRPPEGFRGAVPIGVPVHGADDPYGRVRVVIQRPTVGGAQVGQLGGYRLRPGCFFGAAQARVGGFEPVGGPRRVPGLRVFASVFVSEAGLGVLADRFQDREPRGGAHFLSMPRQQEATLPKPPV